MKKASRFREAFRTFSFWSVRSEPLPSRPHARPLNEDDDDDADKKVALHFAVSERDRVGSCQRQRGGMCRVHAQNRHLSGFGTQARPGRSSAPRVRGGSCAPFAAWWCGKTPFKVVDQIEKV